MIISLVHLPADGLKFDHQYLAGELDTGEYEFDLRQPPLVTGRLDRAGPDIRLRGLIKGQIEATCDRCLAEAPIDMEIPFDLIYTAQDPGAGRTGETEVHGRDLEIALYDKDQIDLDAMVLEQIELSLPTRVLCREDCRGLCPQCGTDLNLEQCDCRPPTDPRWQALADLKEKLEK